MTQRQQWNIDTSTDIMTSRCIASWSMAYASSEELDNLPLEFPFPGDLKTFGQCSNPSINGIAFLLKLPAFSV